MESERVRERGPLCCGTVAGGLALARTLGPQLLMLPGPDEEPEDGEVKTVLGG